MDLTYWLGQMYRTKVVSRTGHEEILRLFRETLTNDPELRAAAEAKRAELTPIVARRGKGDYISERMLEFLGAALEQENA